MRQRERHGTPIQRFGDLWRDNAVPLILLAVLLLLTLVGILNSPLFRSPRNIFNLLRQAVSLGLVSIGQTLVILTGGIDLSVGAVVKLTSLLTAGIMNGREEWMLPAIMAALMVGGTIGLINGLLVTRLSVPPFVATLGTWIMVNGISLLYTTSPIGRIAPPFFRVYTETIGPVPVSVIAFLLFWLMWVFVLRRTAFGRHIYAVGGNERVAHLSGIPVKRVRLAVYTISGLLAAMTGLFLVSRMGVGDPVVGTGLELDSITAVILGGTSLFGGVGSLVGTLEGVLLLSLISNLFNLLDVSTWYQQLIKGAIILGAVAIYKQER
ncbi:MAG: ABC transporter permease [Chloroflexota bacterium]|nr:ABC transporter permease [Chloroflexota bacterium]